MPKILDGKKAKEFFALKLKEKVSALDFVLNLVILQVGDREESNSYIKAKINFAKSLGVNVVHKKFKDNCTEDEIEEEIKKNNLDNNIHGVILQLPIPDGLNKNKILDLISPQKDVDGLSSKSREKRERRDYAPYPATARGVMELLDFYNIDVLNKKVAVLGRSILAGGPIAEIISKRGGIVSVCHSKTIDEEEITKNSDIIIVAIGKSNFLNKKFFNESGQQVVVDVGINRISDGKLLKLNEETTQSKIVGDVDFDDVESMLFAISPVPGGVGQMTVLALFENLFDLAIFNRG